ncbi:FadR/GntR family transcriptional regulator [Salinicola peritrichatus]|uniref:FadR/GntR family transcriptional regulator n=1 Tax=Salinicola peritrichatus TaxID=1267424 RepID=UPI000DA17908|nr:FadR/GntR family transcriptional regulator [Salinicola peritrichatus]
MPLEPTPRSSLVEGVIKQLRAQVLGGQWLCGERIPTEDKLSKALGVGRNTVREAVRVLAHIGLLEVRQGAGTFVRSSRDPSAMLQHLAQAALRDQLEVRRALEVEAARLAALRRTEKDLEIIYYSLGARGDWMDKASLEAFVNRDTHFHLSIVRASHNSTLLELYQFFWTSLQNTIARTENDQQLPGPTFTDHKAVYLAIESGDPGAAAAAAHDMLTPALDTICSAIRYAHPVPDDNDPE